MAKKSDVVQKPVICSACGKSIQPADKLPYPVDCVWRDGSWFCWECLCAAGKIEMKK